MGIDTANEFWYRAYGSIPEEHITPADRQLTEADEERLRNTASVDPIAIYIGNRVIQEEMIAEEKAAARLAREAGESILRHTS